MSGNCTACRKSARRAVRDDVAVVVPGALRVVMVAAAVVVSVVVLGDAVVLGSEDGNNTDS